VQTAWRKSQFIDTRHDYGLHYCARLACSGQMFEAEQDSCAAQTSGGLICPADALSRKPGYNVAASQKKSCIWRQQ
jgi:hypothetical protein